MIGASRKIILLTFLGNLVCPPLLLAQDSAARQSTSAAQDASAGTVNKKGAKRPNSKAQKELGFDYTEWLRDTAIIMTDDERRAFLQLATNEERDQAIEIFWNRRNPEPESPTNEFKEEFYRRLAYADEHFASGIAGRNTDRGRIYVLWGAPDEIDSHPTGGTYDRKPQEGGGSTTTYPWEMWRYRHLDGVGENIEIEFVDPTGSGEYHITRDPCEKDALSHVPGAGLGQAEIFGQSTKAGRFTNTNGTTCPVSMGGITAGLNGFDSLDQYFKVQHAPTHFKDLEEKVSARIVANPLAFQYRTDFLRATSNTALVPITVQLRNRDLSFQGKQGLQSAKLEIYGRISDLGGRVIQKFEDVVTRDFPLSLFPSSQDLSSIYQKSVPLRSGLYRLDLVIKDTQSGHTGVLSTALRVPHFAEEKLDASSLILADQIERVASNQIGGGQFVLGAYKVRPRLGLEFSATDKLGIYLQLYNLRVDESSRQTKVSVGYRITKNGEEVWQGVETPEHLHQNGEQLTIERFVPIAGLAAGKYTMEVSAIDLLSNETIIRSTEFTVKAAAEKKNPAVF
jgi:GWxTD domain-containing protein